MKITSSLPPRGVQVLAVALIGVLAFVAWGGAHILSPTRLGWVMAGGDTPAHYLGWAYFRHTPWLQWPLGANPQYGSDAPGTVVMSDSIPVAAFFFKLWRGWLPRDFQYFGIWALLCCVLQAWFGYRLMQRLSGDFWVGLLGGSFFAIATIFLSRIYVAFRVSLARPDRSRGTCVSRGGSHDLAWVVPVPVHGVGYRGLRA